MSYYQNVNNFEYSDHGMQRIKERLHLKDKTDWEARATVRKLLQTSLYHFDDGHYYYASVGKSHDMFFVFEINQRLLITCTKISAEKQLNLISKGLR